MMRRLVLLLLLGAAASAGVEMDDATRKLFDAWGKKEHHVRDQGITRVSFKIRATVSRPASASDGVFTWTEKADTAKLEWVERVVGQLLQTSGVDASALAEPYDPRLWKRRFAKCKMTAAKKDGQTIVTVKGDNKKRIRSITFDKRGVPVEWVIGGASRTAHKDRPFRIRATYEERKGRLVLKTRTFRLTAPGMGVLETHVRYSYIEVDGLWVLSGMRQEDRFGNSVEPVSTLQFYDYAFELKKKPD